MIFFPHVNVVMSQSGKTSGKTFQEEFKELDPALQKRIRGLFKVSSIWAGLILLGAASFVASKPFLDRRREERERQAKQVLLLLLMYLSFKCLLMYLG